MFAPCSVRFKMREVGHIIALVMQSRIVQCKQLKKSLFFSYNINVFSDERTPNITTISYDELYSTDHKEMPLNDMYLSISSILEGSNLLNKTHNFTGHPDLSKVFY